MLAIIWPLLVALVGLFMFFAIANEKWQRVGFALFCVGSLWTVYLLTGSDFTVGGHPGRLR
jgi:hypothetical protein